MKQKFFNGFAVAIFISIVVYCVLTFGIHSSDGENTYDFFGRQVYQLPGVLGSIIPIEFHSVLWTILEVVIIGGLFKLAFYMLDNGEKPKRNWN